MPHLTPKTTVLLVDDDADFRALVRLAMEESHAASTLPGGLDVREAGDGGEALRFLRRQGEHAAAPRPSLVLLDLEMPGGLDGLSTLRAIKADARLREVATVMFTGVDDDATIRTAVSLGANSYAVKPRDAAGVIAAVDAGAAYWLAVHRTPRPLATGASVASQRPGSYIEPARAKDAA